MAAGKMTRAHGRHRRKETPETLQDWLLSLRQEQTQIPGSTMHLEFPPNTHPACGFWGSVPGSYRKSKGTVLVSLQELMVKW